ncbi:unnamed protein product [Rhizoctonia solani]|uniref:Replication factor A protein 1 n=1 Tax=Rhizoctonia solani TaxID=456999 RepID=A0A8H2Y1C8_9AGAM|nr:unnamed protein product [Rhizoctonia solani]
MAPQLAKNAATRLFTPEVVSGSTVDFQPVLQLLSIKKVLNLSNGSERYRLIYSDGEYHFQSMLTTVLNGYFASQAFTPKCIIRLTHYCTNTIQDKKFVFYTVSPVLNEFLPHWPSRILITLGIEKVDDHSEKVGNPISFNTSQLWPIKQLNIYSNEWKIRARITQKSDIRTWLDHRGEGKVFRVNLVDATGEILAMGYNEAVDNLYSKLEEGKVYIFSKARIRLAKQQFSKLSNVYEIILEAQSSAVLCEDNRAIPQVEFNFTKLSQFATSTVEKDTIVDVLGVITEVHPIDTITLKSTGKIVSKRDIIITDRSTNHVRITIWGKQAVTFQAEKNLIAAFKRVKVGNSGGRRLSLVSSSTVLFYPDIPEARDLNHWVSSEGCFDAFKPLTTDRMDVLMNPS